MTLYYLRALQPHIMETLYYLQQNLGFLPKAWAFAPKLTLGDPVPTGPQHKYSDSPLSHSAGVEIILGRPTNSTCDTSTSAALYMASCLICSTSCFIDDLVLSSSIFCCVLCRLSLFSSVVVEIT